jgi:hypothetical protein
MAKYSPVHILSRKEDFSCMEVKIDLGALVREEVSENRGHRIRTFPVSKSNTNFINSLSAPDYVPLLAARRLAGSLSNLFLATSSHSHHKTHATCTHMTSDGSGVAIILQGKKKPIA